MAHDPTEHVKEHIHHEATHGHGGEGGGQLRWITAAALTAAFLAALAALAGMLATRHLTESTLTRIAANDKWMEYDADSIKRSAIYTRDQTWALTPAEKQPLISKQHEDDQKKKAEYATPPSEEPDPAKPQGMKGIQEAAMGLEETSKKHLETHETFEMSATLFHISIAVVAIAVVARRKEFWLVSIIGGIVGLYFLGSAWAHGPVEHERPGAGQHAPAVPGGATGGGEHAPSGGHAPAGETGGTH